MDTNNQVESTKLNRFAEKMPSKYTNDMISEGEHNFIKKIIEEGNGNLCSLVDSLFPPICNFHTSEYSSIQNRWG